MGTHYWHGMHTGCMLEVHYRDLGLVLLYALTSFGLLLILYITSGCIHYRVDDNINNFELLACMNDVFP